MSEPERAPAATVAALFDAAIDARFALEALRALGLPVERVSVLAGGDEEGAAAGVESGLGEVAGWLHGVATAAPSGCGGAFRAGPLGAALAADPAADGIAAMLAGVGFGADEAGYLALRVAAGLPLVVVAVDRSDDAERLRELLADADAVHLGVAGAPGTAAPRAYRERDAAPGAQPAGS